MSEIIKPVMTDETGKAIVEAIIGASDQEQRIDEISTKTKDLQSQINNIVSPVTEDAEVILARIDDEGETFPTLKARIDKTSSSYRNSDTSVLKDYKMYIGLMNASGTAWTNLNNPAHQHFAIKIEPFSEIKIKANGMSPLYYACLAKYGLEQNPVLADGFTSRKVLATNALDSFRSGKNSEYLYISAITEGKDSVPEYLEINGYIYTDTIKANLNSLIPFKNEYVTPQMFGAIADGVHDDLQAIQTAIDKGGNIFFPKGNYLVSNTIHVVKNNTHLVLHPQAIIECNSITSSDPVYGNGGATINFGYGSTSESDVEYINDVGIEGGIVRNTSPEDNENAIGFSHVNKFYVRNVTIPSCNRKGITAQYWCRNGIIENNKIMSCGFRSISIEYNCDYIDIVNNFIQNDQTGGIRVSDCNYVKIERNNIRQTLGIGIQATRSGVEILHNIVFASNERCISINEEGEAVDDYPVSIIGNIVRSSGQYSIYIASKSLPVTLSNNKDLTTSLANGMVLYNAHGIIMGNVVNRFLISNANGNSTVIGNIFYRFSANSGEGDYIPIILGNTIKDEYGGNLTLPIYLDILNNGLHSSL